MNATTGVSATSVARALNLSVSRVHALAQEPGFPPKFAPGEFDLPKITGWYIRYLQTELQRRGPSGTIETAAILAERLRVLKAQAEKGERENAIERGELLRRDAVAQVWTKRILNCRSRLLAMPTRLAMAVANQPAAYVADCIKREVYEALTELAARDDANTDSDGQAQSFEH